MLNIGILNFLMLFAPVAVLAQSHSPNQAEAKAARVSLFTRLCQGHGATELRSLVQLVAPAMHLNPPAPNHGFETLEMSVQRVGGDSVLAEERESLTALGVSEIFVYPKKTLPFFFSVKDSAGNNVRFTQNSANEFEIVDTSHKINMPTCQLKFYSHKETFSGAGYQRVGNAWVEKIHSIQKMPMAAESETATALCVCKVHSKTLLSSSAMATQSCHSAKDACTHELRSRPGTPLYDLTAICGRQRSKPVVFTGTLSQNDRVDCKIQ